jgi:signal transduction histidine kinase
LEYDEYSDKERKEFIQISYHASQTLVNLLLELLEWGRLSRGIVKVKNEQVELQDVVKEIISLFGSQAKQKEIKLNYKNGDSTIYKTY